MILIITGTISPMVKDAEIVLKNQEERLKQYMEGIRFFIESKAFDKIVFGENSNFSEDRLETLFHIAKENHVAFEYLTFQGDTEQIKLHGKGYGEGEIMEYIFNNSELLKGETDFMKITGRLKIDKVNKLVNKCKSGKTYMNIPNRTIREWYDTRVYVMPVSQFAESFKKVYSFVDDSKGEYLEVVYTKVLKDKRISVKNLPVFPRIVGISGSTGNQYVYAEWKCRIKDILSLFDYYKITR